MSGASFAISVLIQPKMRKPMQNQNSTEDHRLDALMPAEMARKSEAIGEKKANLDMMSTFVLAVLAGAFIALGGVFTLLS